MSNEDYMNQIVMCMNAINAAVEADKIKMNTPRKRKDGSADWAAAAYHFGQISGSSINSNDMRHLYYDNWN